MAWVGITYAVIAFPVLMTAAFSERQLASGMIVLLVGCLMTLFFIFMAKTANGLEHDFHRHYRRARWTAIIVAALFFPIMTIPGILAVRRLERYRSGLPVHES